MDKRIIAPAALALAALSGWYWLSHKPAAETPGQTVAPQPGVIDRAQMDKLGIRLEPAQPSSDLPLALVSGQVTLAPQGRVAVTVPFNGVAVRLNVIEGQAVKQGEALAVVRAPDAIQQGGALARAQADLALAEARARRMTQLKREGIISAARADEAQAQLQQARASVAESRRMLALGGGAPDGTLTLRAPIAGRVARVAIETGGPVDPMTAPFVIENPSAFQIDLQLPEAIARQVRPGMAVEVQLAADADGTGGAVARGTLLSVGASLDPATRSIPARASLEALPGIVAGKGVTVVIKALGTTSGFSVPTAAVTRVDGQAYVFVRQGQRFERRKVTVQTEAGGRSVITSGLKAGEQFAVSGIAELKSMTAE